MNFNKKGKVFVVYENSRYCRIKDIYITNALAHKAISESNGELMDDIDSFEIKGYKNDFDFEINDKCKYFSPKLNMIRELINCLIQIEGCINGGLAHIIVIDDNFKDEDIQTVLKNCNENPDRIEVGLVKLICEELLKLSIEQRALLFTSYYTYPNCDGCGKKQKGLCFGCNIEKGEIEE